MSTYAQWTRLTPAEKAYIATHPLDAPIIKESKDTAFNETARRFGVNGHNDASDAFRHCFWSAILARDLGYFNAYQFTTAHESSPTNDPAEKRMDLHNNSVGLKIGRTAGFIRTSPFGLPDPGGFLARRLIFSNQTLSDKCMTALRNGELITSP